MICSYKTSKLKKSGKNFWDTYKIVAPADYKKGYLKEKVIKDVQGGWIKNYADEDSSTEFNHGSNVKETPKVESKQNADFDLDI